jgi:hypothetical protein
MNSIRMESLDRKGHKKYPSTTAPQIQSNASTTATTTSFDIQKLGDDQVNVEQYVKSLLQKLPNEESVQQLSSQLLDSKDTVSHELRRNVYKNYTEFVVISKEITKLEGDMIAVRRILGEWKEIRETWSLLTLDYDSLESPESSVEKEGLDVVERVDPTEAESRVVLMKSLYREIDGLQKSLPEIPTRQLLFDGSSYHFFEINNDTYKQSQTIFLYVTNDTLFTAIWKKNVISGKNRLTVDRIFPITDIGFIDMKDSPELLYAFKILQHTHTFLYKSASLQEKKTLLQVIQNVTQQILQQKKVQLQTKKSLVLSSPTVKTQALISTTSKKKKKDDLPNGDYMWLLELPDELDVLIAHRDFTQAILMIEKARSLLTQDSPRLQYIRHAIHERITTISRLVSIDLVSPAATQSKIKEDISRLVRLGLGETARDIYLSTRSRTIRQRLRQLQFGGDVVSFVYDYTLVFFKLLKNTCEWFRDSFHDASMASGFMKWVQTELERFSRNVLKQIFMQTEFSLITKCVTTCLDLCQEMETVGMDLGHIFESFMHPELEKAIGKYGSECNEKLMTIVDEDDWKPMDRNETLFSDVELHIKVPFLTNSCLQFYNILTQFGSDIGVLISFSLYSTIVETISIFFATYNIGLLQAMDRAVDVDQLIGIYSDTLFVVKYLFPHTRIQLEDRFDRVIPEFQTQIAEMELHLSRIEAMFHENVFKKTSEHTFPFVKIEYSNSAQVLNTLMPTPEMVSYVQYLRMIARDEIFGPDCVSSSKSGTQRKFGIGGVQLFILDLTYLQTTFEQQLNDECGEKIKILCEKALRIYFLQNKDLTTPLQVRVFFI